jgi:hypothetical protein
MSKKNVTLSDWAKKLKSGSRGAIFYPEAVESKKENPLKKKPAKKSDKRVEK